ncbi:MAG: zinc ribbon domain-containing protein [Candidatus Manganitrophus sp. SA1]|nr:zinc ribbon domain-containing protein [Candidatus Manganitrophus morganii]
MPIYEYACLECKEQFTLLQSLSAKAEETPCPHCGERKSRRLFSTFASRPNGETSSSPPSTGHSHSGGCGCG